MNYNDSWNYIVDEHNQDRSCAETTVQRNWELILSENFGYQKSKKEIISQFSEPIGAGKKIIPDILVHSGDKDLFIAELKQYSLPFTQSMEQQLISYFKLLHLSLGFLVCEKLYLYSYNYAGNLINKVEIPFAKNNANGIKFIELFHKENYNENAIREFIKEQSNLILCPKCQKNYINKTKSFCDECAVKQTKPQATIPSGIIHKGQIFNVSKNYELLNILLGKNMKGYMKAWYRLANNYTIDMQVIDELHSGWTNRLEEPDMFYMDFNGRSDEKLPGHNDAGTPYIALFIKSGKGKHRYYTFHGIYERQSISYDHRIYKRIFDDFTLELPIIKN